MNHTARLKRFSLFKTHTRFPTLPSSSGFTLTELLISISILAVLAALSLPQLNGIYERQKLTNTANELVSELKSVQNKALANNQDRFSIPEASGGPLIDCTAARAYVTGYKIVVNPYGTGYTTNFVFKERDRLNNVCSQPDSKLGTVLLPSTIHFQDADRGDSVQYGAVSGKLTVTPASANELVLVSTRIPDSVLKFHICINQGRVYAQKTACP